MEGTLDDYELLESLKRVHLIEADEDPERSAVEAHPHPAVATTSASAALPTSETATEASATIDTEPTMIEPEPEPELQRTQGSSNIFTNLSTPISTGGANLSQGQRQLVCLARALLKLSLIHI